MKKLVLVSLILVVLPTWACSSLPSRKPLLDDISVFGSSENQRTYEADYDAVFRAAVDALRQVDNNTAKLVKRDQGLIVFKKPNDTGIINVYVRKMDDSTTSVQVEAKNKRKYWFDDFDEQARDAFFSELDALLSGSDSEVKHTQANLANASAADAASVTSDDSEKKAEIVAQLQGLLHLAENERFLEKLSYSDLLVLEEKVRLLDSLPAGNENVGGPCSACYIDLASLYHDSGQYERAAEALKMAIAIEPGNAVAHCNLGDVYKHLRQFDLAIRELEQALSLDPNLPDIYINLGIIYDDYVVDDQKALQYYTRYLELGGTDEQVHSWIKAIEEGS
ncbi:MAG: hypothetical protein Kow0099_00710 [Candidatus Abyssubacteria bacterium]